MVKWQAVRSIILSYVAIVVKGLINAVWWLARGPFDALTVARETTSRQSMKWWELDALLWWVSPVIHGISEGMYRALAEVIGNTVFGIVLILNALRHVILGATRKRAHGILDGLVYGVQGLILDTVATPFTQLYYQTNVAYQDWGYSMALIVFGLCVVRILLLFGPILGVFHLLACWCEGLANALLHEEAQFAPFEGQRRTESISFEPLVDDSTASWQSDLGGTTSHVQNMKMALPKKWFLFSRAKRVVLDDDEVMEKMGQWLYM
jgi:hypothetical protein